MQNRFILQKDIDSAKRIEMRTNNGLTLYTFTNTMTNNWVATQTIDGNTEIDNILTNAQLWRFLNDCIKFLDTKLTVFEEKINYLI